MPSGSTKKKEALTKMNATNATEIVAGERMLSPAEFAARWGVSRQWIYILMGKGLIRRVRVGPSNRLVRIPESELIRLVREDLSKED